VQLLNSHKAPVSCSGGVGVLPSSKKNSHKATSTELVDEKGFVHLGYIPLFSPLRASMHMHFPRIFMPSESG
jgi:hypothetical protein